MTADTQNTIAAKVADLLAAHHAGRMFAARISGTPKPQGSMRSLVTPKTGRIHSKHPTATLDHRSHAATVLAQAWAAAGPWTVGPPLDVPVIVAAVFAFPRPAGHWLPANTRRPEPILRFGAPEWPTSAVIPDTDKLCRLIGDALQLGEVLTDDRLIVGWVARKVWTDAAQGHTDVILRGAGIPTIPPDDAQR